MPAEGLFASLTQRRLKRGVFRSVADLRAAINRILDHHNAHSKPFEKAAEPDKIVAAVRRGYQALVSIREIDPTGRYEHDCNAGAYRAAA